MVQVRDRVRAQSTHTAVLVDAVELACQAEAVVKAVGCCSCLDVTVLAVSCFPVFVMKRGTLVETRTVESFLSFLAVEIVVVESRLIKGEGLLLSQVVYQARSVAKVMAHGRAGVLVDAQGFLQEDGLHPISFDQMST